MVRVLFDDIFSKWLVLKGSNTSTGKAVSSSAKSLGSVKDERENPQQDAAAISPNPKPKLGKCSAKISQKMLGTCFDSGSKAPATG